eukprot:Skav232897  [mRNA]  locus=scaffold1477:66916:77310:- [translate_table: standard]
MAFPARRHANSENVTPDRTIAGNPNVGARLNAQRRKLGAGKAAPALTQRLGGATNRAPLASLPLAPLPLERAAQPSPIPMEISNPEADKVQSVAEYAPEIVDRLFHDEQIFMPRANYMDPGNRCVVVGWNCAILVDWLVEVHMKYRLRPETLFLAVNLIDRYMSVLPVLRRRLQLLGDFVYITDNTYSREELFQMECNMLSTLEFQVVVPTAAHFVNQFVKANGCENPRHAEVIKYIMELALLDLRMIRCLAAGGDRAAAGAYRARSENRSC